MTWGAGEGCGITRCPGRPALTPEVLAGLASAESWRRLPYRQQGRCVRCGYDHDARGRPLLVARASRTRGWLCLICYARANVYTRPPGG